MKSEIMKVKKINLGAVSPSRRQFLKHGSAAAVAIAVSPLAFAADDKKNAAEKIIGIQLGAVSFVDEGVEKVLDYLKEKVGVNAIFISTFCYDRGLNGRQFPGQPFPDHGPKKYDEDTYHGGFYATPHAKFYSNTAIKGDKLRAPDLGDFDVLAQVIPVAKKKGIKVFASVLDTWAYPDDVLASQLTGFTEVDLQGENKKTICFFKPDVRAFWQAVVTDLASSYDLDGIMFFNERNGPLINAVGATHAETFSSSHITCFCDDHKRVAQEKGIDFDRAKEGYHKLDAFVKQALQNQRPSDGYYVEFQRLLLAYPEIVAYQQLFDFGKHAILRDVRDAVKAVKKDMMVGFHIEHVNSWNPFYRAGRNYEELATMADLLKVVVYNNCGGERYVNYIRNIQSCILRDVPPEEVLRFNNHLCNYGDEASLDKLPTAGLSPDYVYRETARAIEGAKGKCKILPGIDIGIPTEAGNRKASPDDTYAATIAAFRAKPDGVIFSRKYSEMMLTNIEAGGRAVKDSLKLLAVMVLSAALYFSPVKAHAQQGHLSSANTTTRQDAAWTPARASEWFASMDWFKGRGEQKKKYDAFGRELEPDTPAAILNKDLIPDPSANKLEFARQYNANPSRWDKAFAFLKTTDFSTIQPGRYPIDGDDVYAVITLGPGKSPDTSLWESHHNYEDIHYVISGKEQLGIAPVSQAKVLQPYDSAKDLAHYTAKGKYYVAVPGTFYIVTTEEAHRPGLKADGYDGDIKKLYIKVRKS